MKTIPLLDYVGTPLIVCSFLVLLLLQWCYPLRRQHFSALRRVSRNLLVSIPSHVVLRWAALPVPLALAAWMQHQRLGLLNWVAFPVWVRVAASFLLMDYAYWWWHWVNHMIPFFWRFHNVHHTDLDMDVSTASRFHFGEMVFSTAFLSLVVLLFGIGPITFAGFFIVFEAATLFHHSNWRLPISLERILNHVIVTPRMHGIHHSIVQRETNSNWGTIFCWWDKLHGTLRRDIAQDEITIGVPAYREENELTFGRLWLLPFQRQRDYWRLPSGKRPERAGRPADQLSE
jgi:sterol desaturase/sphingolipid hydroxylase (fatty acid hydroxylase superfamily)